MRELVDVDCGYGDIGTGSSNPSGDILEVSVC
jgi:hypothetical protein